MKSKFILLTGLGYFPKIGGVENSLHYLNNVYRKQGRRVVTISDNSGCFERIPTWKISRVRGALLLKYRYSRIIALTLFFALMFIFRLRKRVEVAICRDHIHAFACSLIGINYCYVVPGIAETQHNYPSKNFFKVINRKLNYLLQKRVIASAPALFVLSENMREEVQKLNDIREVKLVSPGVDSARFQFPTAAEKKEIEKEFELKTGRTRIICVGRLNEEKGFDLAIDAMKKVSSNVELIIVGNGPLAQQLRHQAFRENVNDRVTFMGQSHAVDKLLKISDVFLLSSRYEPFGQVLIEALACGLPVVGFSNEINAVRVATDDITDGMDCGCLSTIFSGDGLADCIMRVLDKQYDREAISEHFRQIYSWDRFANSILMETSKIFKP